MIILESLLESLRAQTAILTHRSPVEDDAWQFMMSIFELGLLLEADPSRRPAVRGVLAETARHLDEEIGIIERFAWNTRTRHETGWSEDPDQWRDLCTRRSALAFFFELYEDSPLSARLPFINQAGLDEIMRDYASHGNLLPEEIPAHMPTRHWWWWLPGAPPS